MKVKKPQITFQERPLWQKILIVLTSIPLLPLVAIYLGIKNYEKIKELLSRFIQKGISMIHKMIELILFPFINLWKNKIYPFLVNFIEKLIISTKKILQHFFFKFLEFLKNIVVPVFQFLETNLKQILNFVVKHFITFYKFAEEQARRFFVFLFNQIEKLINFVAKVIEKIFNFAIRTFEKLKNMIRIAIEYITTKIYQLVVFIINTLKPYYFKMVEILNFVHNKIVETKNKLTNYLFYVYNIFLVKKDQFVLFSKQIYLNLKNFALEKMKDKRLTNFLTKTLPDFYFNKILLPSARYVSKLFKILSKHIKNAYLFCLVILLMFSIFIFKFLFEINRTK